MRNNRKGVAIDNAVPLIIFLIVGAIFIVTLRFYENKKAEQQSTDIKLQKSIADANVILISFLRNLNDKDESNAESISRLHDAKDYGGINSIIKSYFDKRLSHVPVWKIEVSDPLGGITAAFSNNYGNENQYYKVKLMSEAAVPSANTQAGPIKITLFYGITQ